MAGWGVCSICLFAVEKGKLIAQRAAGAEMRNRKGLREKNLGQGRKPGGVGRGNRGPVVNSRTEESRRNSR